MSSPYLWTLIAGVERVAADFHIKLTTAIISADGDDWEICVLTAKADDVVILGGSLGLQKKCSDNGDPLYCGEVDFGFDCAIRLTVTQGTPAVLHRD